MRRQEARKFYYSSISQLSEILVYTQSNNQSFFFLIYLFILFYGCVGSSFLCEGFLQLRKVGATLHRGARASHYRGLSRCGAQAPDAQAQQLWLTGLVAPRHVGSSQTRARTRVPCIGRWILNHCATREAPQKVFMFQKYVLKYLQMNAMLFGICLKIIQGVGMGRNINKIRLAIVDDY